MNVCSFVGFLFLQQMTADELRSSDGSADVCSSDLTGPVARLRVPAAEVDLTVLAVASGRTLAFGPAVVEGTEGLGHQILSGHRDTHFAFLRDLPDGTRLELQDAGGTWHAYRVRGHQVIDVRQPVTAQPEIGRAPWRERVCQDV